MSVIAQTTIGGEACLLILKEPDWSDPVTLGLRHETELVRGQTRRENRRQRHNTLRLRQRALFYFNEGELEDLRNELAVLGTDLVAMPVWADMAPYADYADRYFDAQHWLTYDDGAANYALNAGTYAHYAPLMFGRLESDSVTALSEETGEAELTLLEQSPYSHRVDPRTVSVSADWPVGMDANWVSDPVEIHSDGHHYVKHSRGGRQHDPETPETVFRWEQSAEFDWTNRADISTFLNFWHARKGRLQDFAVPTFLQPGVATADAPHALQARFAADELELVFAHPGHATATVKFIQLPWELNPPTGETAVQPPEAWLLQIDYDIPGKASAYFTDWEDAITYQSNSHTPFNFKVERLDKDLKLQNLEMRLVYYSDASDPLLPFVQGGLERLIRATLYSGDPTDTGTMIKRFVGTLKPVRLKGREVRAVFDAFGGALDRELPWFSYTKRCNYVLGDANCKYDLEANKNTGTGVSADLGDADFSLYVRSLTGGLSAGVLDPNGVQWDRFAGGYLEVGTGDDYQLRFIVKSDYEAGTDRRVYMSRPLDGTKLDNAGSPATVTLYPGCAGNKWECEDAFGNYVNFGGMPYMPDQLEQLQGTGAPTGGK